ncbi:MAG TPA: NAD-dependent epimerase/dehydratase family protein [candidate division WOR-3 bacterium]|uniref:NAD-dependent epimerase/dehydratase family protein n=1 Tax=candidate division WOR-3 bacterium TaxID=2052148 RepID=A0A7C5DDB0_UNCW3|nr:NAD-dependent epimerase/dehydratase family protein [candidate division WOR-3 bacterium]
MKALVTGATGFIGARMTKYLTDKGYEVYALVRKNSKLDRLKKLNVYPKLIYGDITNLDSLNEAVREKDYVFHLAAVIMQTGGKITIG